MFEEKNNPQHPQPEPEDQLKLDERLSRQIRIIELVDILSDNSRTSDERDSAEAQLTSEAGDALVRLYVTRGYKRHEIKPAKVELLSEPPDNKISPDEVTTEALEGTSKLRKMIDDLMERGRKISNGEDPDEPEEPWKDSLGISFQEENLLSPLTSMEELAAALEELTKVHREGLRLVQRTGMLIEDSNEALAEADSELRRFRGEDNSHESDESIGKLAASLAWRPEAKQFREYNNIDEGDVAKAAVVIREQREKESERKKTERENTLRQIKEMRSW